MNLNNVITNLAQSIPEIERDADYNDLIDAAVALTNVIRLHKYVGNIEVDANFELFCEHTVPDHVTDDDYREMVDTAKRNAVTHESVSGLTSINYNAD